MDFHGCKTRCDFFMADEKQAVLLEVEDSDGVLFSREERKARYTARQVSELERLREAVFMLLPAWPIEDIARRLHMNTRTVRALAAQDAEKLAGSKRDFTNVLRSTADRWLALARTRESEATFQQLAIGLGIIMDKARDLELMGLAPENEALKENVDRVAAAAELRRMLTEDLARQVDGKGQEVLPKASPSAPAEANRRAATLQPVVSCGVESEARPDITLEPKPETPTKPA